MIDDGEMTTNAAMRLKSSTGLKTVLGERSPLYSPS